MLAHETWLIGLNILAFSLAQVITQAATVSIQEMSWVTGPLGDVNTLNVLNAYNRARPSWYAGLTLIGLSAKCAVPKPLKVYATAS